MRYSILGRSGLRVSKLALGTMTFGTAAEWSRSEEECRPIFDAYVEAGGNFIDTANIYTGGESEKMVGRFIASDRDRFVVATKYANAVPGRGDPNEAGVHRKSLTRSLDASLKRLGTDYIDLYFVHWWDFTTPVEEVQRALTDAISAGKILHIGLSDVPAWVVSRAQTFHDLRGLAPIACMQLEYSLVQRSIEREHIPLAQAHDIGITAWSPLAGGILSGKYTGGAGDNGPKRMDSMQLQQLDDRNRAIALAVAQVAQDLDARPSQVALAWIIARGVIPVAGATRVEQMRENLAATELILPEAAMANLNAASAFDAGHPYSMLNWDMPMALGYAGMFDQIDIARFPQHDFGTSQGS
ncbi:aldo/keto reductase [Sphingobium limneticum]|jgi:aryl-alcohol dehydrogenase-like predicted oxidoreductase|uniref:aldo/keto reductase n=1 Tax=Sphingobium limneticum TaxID=1007511 RepID=UPI003D0820E5